MLTIVFARNTGHCSFEILSLAKLALFNRMIRAVFYCTALSEYSHCLLALQRIAINGKICSRFTFVLSVL